VRPGVWGWNGKRDNEPNLDLWRRFGFVPPMALEGWIGFVPPMGS
jgi:hypothetical protein